MNSQYYIIRNNEQIGPLTKHQIISINNFNNTKFWKTGMQDWVIVNSLNDVIKYLELDNNILPVNTASTEFNNSNYAIASNTVPFPNTNNLLDPIQIKLASPGSRILVFFINIIAYVLLSTIIELLIGAKTFSYIIYLGITAYSFYKYSGTVGHMALQLQVVDCNNYALKNEFIIGTLREFVKHIMTCFLIPVLWLLWDKQQQALYDKMFNTIVIHKKIQHDYL